MEKIILYGGSFDPVHNGHLRIARAASLLLNADLIFVPSKAPRWKKTSARAADRVNMLKEALKADGSTNFSLSLVELNKPGTASYTYDTLQEFKALYPKKEFIILIGEDQVEKFPTWYKAEELVKEASVYYVPRDYKDAPKEVCEKYHIQRLPYLEAGKVSSSAVRSLKCLDIPPVVLQYIEKHELYFIKKVKEYLDDDRYLHSLSVAHLAQTIMLKNSLENSDKGYIAGLLHDIGKVVPEIPSRKLVKKNDPEYQDFPAYALHQFVGSYIAKHDLEIEDEEVLDAIKFHCSGKAHMMPLSKIIYSADKIEPLRGYDSSKMVKACLRNYYTGFLNVLEENRKFLKSQSKPLPDNPLSEECYQLYFKEEQ